ncbi:adaptin-binding domain-containing protein [Aspergillus candidus]|uniref:Alpha and gamma adaptin binding protein p34-domain-containing protein n=1 Tax=Aspergillus candidus TaxID=41067 RepID=A0A2I2FC67_ASPCN|nr:alpha and gamma adaptin binding protein p34-domain-containing protein [Aspergillus candidus]PLB38212.1 alpha and gamma adaptin binding protein p34-domain-containing protein [Aspergillus candidus]
MSQKPPAKTPDQIRSPRRLLTLTPTSHSLTIIPPFLHSLTGVAVTDPPTQPSNTDSPSQPQSTEQTPTFAGYTTHPPLHLENKYYTADVPIWVDEIPLSTSQPHSSSDESNSESNSPAKWRAEFSSDEALPVRDAIGALVVCVRNPSPPPSSSTPAPPSDDTPAPPAAATAAAENNPDVEGIKTLMKAVGDIKSLIEEERSDGGDVLTLLVLVGDTSSAATTTATATAGEDDDGDGNGAALDDEPFSELWWEDQMFEMGLVGVEVVRWDPRVPESEMRVRNSFGEYQGMTRIREVLETHDWNGSSETVSGDVGVGHDDDLEKYLLGLDGDGEGSDIDDEDTGFGLEVNELEREMVGLRMAIEKGGDVGLDSEIEGGEDDEDEDDLRVDSLGGLMLRMQAIKDMSAELPEQERKRFAARAVRDIMKEV